MERIAICIHEHLSSGWLPCKQADGRVYNAHQEQRQRQRERERRRQTVPPVIDLLGRLNWKFPLDRGTSAERERETSKIPCTCVCRKLLIYYQVLCFVKSRDAFFCVFIGKSFAPLWETVRRRYIMHIMFTFQLKKPSSSAFLLLSLCLCFALLVLFLSLFLLCSLSAVRFVWLKFFAIEQVFN